VLFQYYYIFYFKYQILISKFVNIFLENYTAIRSIVTFVVVSDPN